MNDSLLWNASIHSLSIHFIIRRYNNWNVLRSEPSKKMKKKKTHRKNKKTKV